MEEKYLDDLNVIRSLMEDNSKYLSLSGISGILAGVYAIIAGFIADYLIHHSQSALYLDVQKLELSSIVIQISALALVTLVLSLITAYILTKKKANKAGNQLWNKASKKLLFNFMVPFLTGAAVVLIIISKGYLYLATSSCLIFYGLALFSASHYTLSDIRYLGMAEILLGLVAMLLKGHGLTFWILGFGVLHILYGSIMYFKYDR